MATSRQCWKMHTSDLVIFIALPAVTFCFLLQQAVALSTDPVEVVALNTIRRSLNDPLGNLNSWNSGDPCTSNWNGIFCYPMAISGYLHVQQLQLLQLNLSGSLAPEFGQLSQLQILDVMWNKISGTIPREIGKITTLKLLLYSLKMISNAKECS
ncbi:hypothetical protein HPP92_019254 [Vanilla planifolia]|uniref:Leucine-rich repeat-containing N-terminal plant-type domain-containing protein n=1 Tax=Vanilla planifolia TaxID=51239 RepID=A0A835Q6G6_VANPL|nr:hypothetical protein HPP92_019254 [Vanilla planifolia]